MDVVEQLQEIRANRKVIAFPPKAYLTSRLFEDLGRERMLYRETDSGVVRLIANSRIEQIHTILKHLESTDLDGILNNPNLVYNRQGKIVRE